MGFVFDASAILAFVHNEPGSMNVRRVLLESDVDCHVHAVNLCEVEYDLLRTYDGPATDLTLFQLNVAGLRRNDFMSAGFCRSVAGLKAEFKRVSLADCFGLALAERLGATFLTADRHELGPLASTGRFDITFIR